MNLRYLNQDPMENFFGLIRANGCRDIKPSCQQFSASFKSLFIDNLTSSHSIGANCAPDDSRFIISWADYIELDDDVEPDYYIPPGPTTHFFSNDVNNQCSFQSVCKDIGVHVPQCKDCKTFFTNERAVKDIYMDAKEILSNLFPKIFLKIEIKIKAINFMQKEMNFEHLNCVDHKDALKKKFLNVIFDRYLLSICTHLNRILCGKITLKDLNSAHPFELKAYDQYIKYTKNKEEKLKIRSQIACCKNYVPKDLNSPLTQGANLKEQKQQQQMQQHYDRTVESLVDFQIQTGNSHSFFYNSQSLRINS